jgi:hypothetical protein
MTMDLYEVGDAKCTLSPCEESGLSKENIKWVTDLHVPENMRRKGFAKALLSKLGKEADATQTALLLEVRPIDDTITEDILESMYKRHGFIKVQDSPKLMLRVPVPPMLFEQLAKKKTSSIITNIY